MARQITIKPLMAAIGTSLVLLSANLALPASASAAFNLTASPLPTNLTAQPGTTTSTPLRIQNTGTDSAHVKVTLMKFKAFGQNGMPEILEPTSADSYIKWVSFSENNFVLAPQSWHTTTMTISVPKEAAFGYYYAVVFSLDNGQQPQISTAHTTAVNGAIASLILLDVPAKGEKRKLEVSDFTTTKHVYEYLPANFDITVKNTGNIHAIPSGNIFIRKSGSQDIIATLSINPGQGNVLPNSTRKFSTQWSDGWPAYRTVSVNNQVISDKSGKPLQKLDWNGGQLGKFRFGQYKASLTLVYNDGQRDVPVEGDISFWVIPWKLLGIALLIAILLGFGLWTILRNTSKRLKKRLSKNS